MTRTDTETETERAAEAETEAVAESDDTEVESVLVGDDLTLSYDTSDGPVVDCTRIDVPRGAVTAVVGPNGSGKSTLLKALSDHLAPDEGSVLLRGEEIDTYGSKELARKLGFLSQERDSPGGITVAELVARGRYPYREFFGGLSDEDREAVERALELAGIEHLRDAELGQLSGGQKQLAWIAMVLAQETGVLLLDEPTTFLDLQNQFRVLETVRNLNERQNTTVAVVLHDVSQAARFADYLIAIDDGRLYDWGTPDDVVTEQLLADVFGVEATVHRDPELQILPKRALPKD